jgi:hypothetical protein
MTIKNFANSAIREPKYFSTNTYQIFATGGDTIGTYSLGAINYRYHKFTNTGSFEIVTGESPVECLLVAGGGGGGASGTPDVNNGGGGGGAGGFLLTSLYLTPGVYTITIGGGGTGATTLSVKGAVGTDSTITNSASVVLARAYGGGGEVLKVVVLLVEVLVVEQALTEIMGVTMEETVAQV